MIICKIIFKNSAIKIIVFLSFIIDIITMYLQKNFQLFTIMSIVTIFIAILFIIESILNFLKYKKALNIERKLTIKELESIYIYNKEEINNLKEKNILLEGKIKSINIEKNFFIGTNIKIDFLTDNNINIGAIIEDASYKFKKHIRRMSKYNKLTLIGNFDIKDENLTLYGIYLKK